MSRKGGPVMQYLALLPKNEDLAKISGWRPGRGPGARPLVNFSCPKCLTMQTVPLDNSVLKVAGGKGITAKPVECQGGSCGFSDRLALTSWWQL